MGKGKSIGLSLGAILATASACSLVEPIPPFEYDQALLLDASGEWEDDPDPDATLDTSEASDMGRDHREGDTPTTADANGEDGGTSDASRNPCPSYGFACCGGEGGMPGPLYCAGFRCDREYCAACLQAGCDTAIEFCCTSGGDTEPAVCMPYGKLCGM
jgi:hypothetical protein